MKPLVPLLGLLTVSSLSAAPAIRTQEILSKVYAIDRIYRSMEGPSSVQKIFLGDPAKPELLWIVGIKTEMVGEDGKRPQLPELMCHVNVDLDAAKHQAVFDFRRTTATRLMTLSQGMLEVKLPAGFGFPIASNEPLLLFTQVLNHNIEKPRNILVRHRVTFEYIRDSEADGSMTALFNVGASGMVQLENNPIALASMMPSAADGIAGDEEHGANCLVGARAPQAMSSSADYTDPNGRKMTGHWLVPPGRQVNASDITWFLQLPYDTRVHYAAFHLHPFAESLSIRDVTAGTTLVKASAKNPKEGVGLTHVDTVSSTEGLPIYRNHKYDLVSVYNNPTKENADSMASAFLALRDPEFVRQKPDDFARRAAAIIDSETLVIKTSAGDLKARMMRDIAPSTSVQVARLVAAGIFNGTKATDVRSDIRVTVPGSEKIYAMLQPLGDRAVPFDRGMVAYCPPSSEAGEVSLRFISNPQAAQDARCIPFARLIEGAEIVDAISKSPVPVTAFIGSVTFAR